MHVKRFVLNSMGTNTYVIGDPGSDVILLDPSHPNLQPVLEYVKEQKMNVRLIVNTHGHFDHIAGNEAARTLFQAPLWCHDADVPLLFRGKDLVQMYFGVSINVSQPDANLCEGMDIKIGGVHFTVLETPGHSPGSVCLYDREAQVLMSGDTLFAGTVGRTDFPESDAQAMMASLKNKLYPLPDDVKIYPGHEEDSTIGEERMCNPFFHFV